MELHEIKTAILTSDLNIQSINRLIDILEDKKTMDAKDTFSVGDKVWVVQKTKRTEGIIEKMAIKKAVVFMKGSKYRVPFSMLEIRS
ncbi:hypothetical protein [uncultured Maribacter sp.]|uniref:hypothetical protein n=1 Tax=uncultured Maribacter sp. TaxID=431308 RepID=UPI0030EEBBBE|tara:strand:+ start:1980 stop:2240 length:261 start_codon:yes stop_codon:yes gene_type:complete